MRVFRKLSALAAVCVCLGACGGSADYTGPGGGPGTGGNPGGGGSGNASGVTVANNYFTPSTFTITAGQSVTWAWDACSTDPYGSGSTCVNHGVVFDDGATSAVQSQGTYSRTFMSKGTYRYHCSVHGTAMSGTITVQ